MQHLLACSTLAPAAVGGVVVLTMPTSTTNTSKGSHLELLTKSRHVLSWHDLMHLVNTST